MDPKDLRKLYNHPTWPSPRARIVAKNLGLKMKRITHEVALDFLSWKCGLTLHDFLQLEQKESWRQLGCIRYLYNGSTITYNPVYSRRYNKA